MLLVATLQYSSSYLADSIFYIYFNILTYLKESLFMFLGSMGDWPLLFHYKNNFTK